MNGPAYLRASLLVGLIVWLAACTSYKRIGLDELADHEQVRVTKTDETYEIIVMPYVDTDSIKGQDSASIPLDQVADVRAKKKDTASTVLLVGVSAAAITLVTLRVAECATNSYGSSC